MDAPPPSGRRWPNGEHGAGSRSDQVPHQGLPGSKTARPDAPGRAKEEIEAVLAGRQRPATAAFSTPDALTEVVSWCIHSRDVTRASTTMGTRSRRRGFFTKALST